MNAFKQLPGRMKAFYGMKGIIARSLGYSRTHNPRNLEFLWYPLWSHILHETFRDVPNLLICPQWPVWITDELQSPQETQHEGGDFEPDPADTEGEALHGDGFVGGDTDPGRQHSARDVDDEDDFGNSASFSQFLSGASTIALRNVLSQIIDHAGVLVQVQSTEHNPSHYNGLRPDVVTIPLLIEEKRHPSRSLSPQELKKEIENEIAAMGTQIRTQAAFAFARCPSMDSLIAIAAVGPYWSCTTILRKDHGLSEEDLHKIRKGESTSAFKSVADTVNMHKWLEPAPLGSKKSNDRLQRIHQKIKDLAFQDILQPVAAPWTPFSKTEKAVDATCAPERVDTAVDATSADHGTDKDGKGRGEVTIRATSKSVRIADIASNGANGEHVQNADSGSGGVPAQKPVTRTLRKSLRQIAKREAKQAANGGTAEPAAGSSSQYTDGTDGGNKSAGWKKKAGMRKK
ncbi:hypothetical protein OBBRIDRAFT_849621 [Obba rivulosa]|uniref:Uncharacterized protein n=1 Tax=Obba rivulosa TaxID=1052685 RepID=A0A8E2DHU9_9APHY|nr:hypothetical protein OBBRIDRAFT_849621 [Obba rivulosa]